MKKEHKLINVIFDIQFESNLKGEIFLGIIAQHFQVKEIIETPLLSIPEPIRKNDSNLKYQPIYEILLKENFKILVGTYSIGIKFFNYENWQKSFEVIKKLLNILNTSQFEIDIKKIGLRYVNFYENFNIYELETVKILINNNLQNNKKLHLRILEENSKINLKLIIDNNINIDNKKGSVVDITSSAIIKKNDNFLELITKLHDEIKKTFKEISND